MLRPPAGPPPPGRPLRSPRLLPLCLCASCAISAFSSAQSTSEVRRGRQAPAAGATLAGKATVQPPSRRARPRRGRGRREGSETRRWRRGLLVEVLVTRIEAGAMLEAPPTTVWGDLVAHERWPEWFGRGAAEAPPGDGAPSEAPEGRPAEGLRLDEVTLLQGEPDRVGTERACAGTLGPLLPCCRCRGARIAPPPLAGLHRRRPRSLAPGAGRAGRPAPLRPGPAAPDPGAGRGGAHAPAPAPDLRPRASSGGSWMSCSSGVPSPAGCGRPWPDSKRAIARRRPRRPRGRSRSRRQEAGPEADAGAVGAPPEPFLVRSAPAAGGRADAGARRRRWRRQRSGRRTARRPSRA